MTTPTSATAPRTSRQLPTRSSRSSTVRIISPEPIGRAAARQMLEISSAGVVMKVSSAANS